MNSHVAGFAAACAAGVAVAFINDLLSRLVLRRSPEMLVPFFIVRQMINVAYLVALYFLAPLLPWEPVPLLAGGAAGVTVASILLALRLVKQRGGDEGSAKAADNTISEREDQTRNG